MRDRLLLLAALGGLGGVACGAFGAHGLRDALSPEMLEVYKTGVNYQMWHSLALAIVAALRRHGHGSNMLAWSGWLFVVGIVLFSGSLYVLAVTQIRALGMVTPFGGVAFLLGWVLLGVYAYRTAPD